MNDISELVRQSALGAELSEEDLTVLCGLMKSRTLADGDGKLEVVKRTGADELASIAVLRDGDLAGELSFIDGGDHTVGLRALCESEVLSLARVDFEGVVNDNPQLVYKVMRAVARSAHRIVHRMNNEFVELSNYIFKQHGRY
jgi:CRP-like cAMP-binding protein